MYQKRSEAFNITWMEVEGYRTKERKVRQRVLKYYGRTDPRKEPDAKPITKELLLHAYDFEGAALLYKAGGGHQPV
ncbi:hypothetical protein [Thermoplasma volcanium]|uniref:hypothetical protein n=1 Tax=Thermoplasma volcanium TaxID=50339 RepID=UPI00064EB736|nr:hypothetical protein [Thermoplasma volcanium]